MAEGLTTYDCGDSGEDETLLNRSGIGGHSREKQDLITVSRAIRHGWNVPQAMRERVRDRLGEIIEKRSVMVPTRDGEIALDGPADANAIRAAAVVLQMTSQDQADAHLAEKNARLDEGKPTERVGGVTFELHPDGTAPRETTTE